MSFKFKKNVLGLLDSAISGLLTVNRVVSARNNFNGVHNTNIFIEEIRRKNSEDKLKKDTKEEDKLKEYLKVDKDENQFYFKDKFADIKSEEKIQVEKPNPTQKMEFNDDQSSTKFKEPNLNDLSKQTNSGEAERIIPRQDIDLKIDIKEEIINQTEEQKEDPFLIKSDKLKFAGKQTKIPVTAFSRMMNFGMLGASLISNTLTQMAIDRVSFSKKEEEQKTFSHYLVNETNAERLSRTLCKMRGAALKLGQILR